MFLSEISWIQDLPFLQLDQNFGVQSNIFVFRVLLFIKVLNIFDFKDFIQPFS